MRPIRLTMEAFGSYGERTVIDFTMPNQNLFLVTGDTGSGKTTIFEAIVFALYGKAADKTGKNGKAGMDFQSQYVGKDVKPFVELKFSEREGETERYFVVTRVPQHERKLLRKSKTNPEGIRVESESVTMLLLPDENSEEGTPVAQSMAEINRKSADIVGLSKEQFTQVAMIEQGKFMDLLRSGTDERKKMFSRLFNTGIYHKITEETAERLRGTRSRNMGLLEVCRQAVLQTVIPEGDDGPAAQMREEREEIRGMDRFAVTRLSDFSENLAVLVRDLQAEREKAQQRLKAAVDQRDGAREALTRAESLVSAYRQLEEAEQTLKRCDEQADEIAGKQRLLETIGKSFEIFAVKRTADAAKEKLDGTKKTIGELEQALPEVQSRLADAEDRSRLLGRKRDQALADLTAVKEKADRARAALREIRAAEKNAEEYRRGALDAEKLAKQAGEQLEQLKEKESAAQTREKELSGVPLELEKIRVRLDLGERIIRRADELMQDARKAGEAKRRAEDLQKKYRDAGEKYSGALLGYREKRSAFYDNIAGVMASDLTEGAPCPVCGSVSHPHPASLRKGETPVTEEELDRLEKQVDELGEAQRKLSEEAGSAKAAWEERAKALSAGAAELLSDADEFAGGKTVTNFTEAADPEEVSARLSEGKALAAETADAVRRETERLEKAEEERQKARSEAEKCREKIEALTDEAAKLRDAADVANTAAERSAAVLENVKKAELDFRTEEEADRAQNAAEDDSARAQRNYQSALEEEKSLKTAADRTAARLADRRGELPDLKKRYDQETEAYLEAMKSRGLQEEDWMRVTRQFPDEKEECRLLREAIGVFRETRSGAERLKEAAVRAIGDQKKPDLSALEEARRRTEATYQTAAQEETEADRIWQADQAALHTLQEKLKEGAQSIRLEERLSHLYSVLAGKVSGSRMDVETFAQRYYLEQILVSANARFREMSMGQFELRMVDIDRAGEGRNRGLDLMVYSYVTGKEREIRTLSGGESFIAALSLALGMADQITAGRSSIHLDMMFIDEGFGTLDDRSLEQAVRTLRKMAGGSKLIGIISHVSELRQEMEDQLIVSRNDRGSHVRWQIS